MFPRGLTTSHGFSRAAYGGLWSYLGFCVSAFERSADKARAFEKPETIARSECIISGAKRACGHFKKKRGRTIRPKSNLESKLLPHACESLFESKMGENLLTP